MSIPLKQDFLSRRLTERILSPIFVHFFKYSIIVSGDAIDIYFEINSLVHEDCVREVHK